MRIVINDYHFARCFELGAHHGDRDACSRGGTNGEKKKGRKRKSGTEAKAE